MTNNIELLLTAVNWVTSQSLFAEFRPNIQQWLAEGYQRTGSLFWAAAGLVSAAWLSHSVLRRQWKELEKWFPRKKSVSRAIPYFPSSSPAGREASYSKRCTFERGASRRAAQASCSRGQEEHSYKPVAIYSGRLVRQVDGVKKM